MLIALPLLYSTQSVTFRSGRLEDLFFFFRTSSPPSPRPRPRPRPPLLTPNPLDRAFSLGPTPLDRAFSLGPTPPPFLSPPPPPRPPTHSRYGLFAGLLCCVTVRPSEPEPQTVELSGCHDLRISMQKQLDCVLANGGMGE